MENKILFLLKKLVSINSVYPNEQKLINYLSQYFADLGFKVYKQKVENNRFNLMIEKGIGKKSILLYSHLDTVGLTEGWKTNPFKLTIKGDRAYGLGAWDMKSGMAVNILTFLNFQPKNFILKLALCCDEENISQGGHKLMNSDFLKDVSCVISTEPAFQYGLQGIVTGRIGRAVYDVCITAPSRHFALYAKKYDLNLFVGRFLTELQRFNFVFARKIQSSAIGMSIPQKTEIQLDSSVRPPKTHKDILSDLKNILTKLNKSHGNYFDVKISFVKRDTPFLESYKIKKDNKYLKKLGQVVKITLNKKAISYFRSSVADENIFGHHGKTVLGIGPKGGNAHSANEWVSLSSLSKLYIIINRFLNSYDLG